MLYTSIEVVCSLILYKTTVPLFIQTFTPLNITHYNKSGFFQVKIEIS